MRVLLVQSDMRSTQPLVRFFKQRGDEVWQAWELGQAVGMLEQVKPELMLMDLHFPNQEWQTFLRNARTQNPGMNVIVTNKYPDLQREMVARENGVTVFLRQPFSARWIEQAMTRLTEGTQPVRVRKEETPRSGAVRMPMRMKITLPYLLLALLFALAAAYVISQVVMESVQERFLNQLVATARQASDWMVGEEDRLLESLRLVANSEGVAEAMQSGDAEALRTAGAAAGGQRGRRGIALAGYARDEHSLVDSHYRWRFCRLSGQPGQRGIPGARLGQARD